MILKITEEHLDKAIELQRGSISISKTCIVTVAAKEQFPQANCSAQGQIFFNNHKGRTLKNQDLKEIMEKFDKGWYAILRQQLPVTLELEYDSD